MIRAILRGIVWRLAVWRGGTLQCPWCKALPSEPCAKLARHLPCGRVAA